MIELHYWPTPNGHKVTLLLEELADAGAPLQYRIVPVDIGKGAQFEPAFLAISPNNKMPAIVDHAPEGGGGPLGVFESGAILQYLAEKTGRFLPTDFRDRWETLQWLYWQVGGLGPMTGQHGHFSVYAPDKVPYAIDRYLAGRTDVTVAANVKITSSWRHDMPEFYDVLPRQHIPMVPLQARMPSTDPIVNFNTPVEMGYDANGAVAESTRCLMCNYNIWFDPFRCVLCGACADVCPEGVIHMIDVNQMKSEGLLPELEEAYGWENGGAMILDEERCIRCALCVKRCPFDAITMERFELQEISTDGRLYKESYRDAQLAGTPGVAGGAR